ncbi:MAG: creatininase family protein [Cyclobacteriaceae bacterium]
MKKYLILLLTGLSFLSTRAQTNELWLSSKVKNYLPHMTVPEVEDLLTRTDMVIIPVGAIEQHGYHLPLGTDFLNGVERCKLLAQERDVLVAPILMAGQSPYHMGFAGTITLSAETIMKVHLEAVESLIRHGFKRFMILNSHGGNRAISTLLVDQINQTTAGIAVDMGEAIRPFSKPVEVELTDVFDRHGGVWETSSSQYLIPSLVQMDKAVTAELTLPPHMAKMLPEVVDGDRTALLVFLAEGLKAEETGKGTSSKEMSTTGVWGVRDLKEASAELGLLQTDNFVQASVQFIDRWNELRPFGTDK